MLIQRLGNNNQKNQDYIDEFIGMVKNNRGCCDEVWLSTLYGFPPVKEHVRTAEILAVSAKKLKENGIKVSLQISNTIGHGAYISYLDCSALAGEGSVAEKMVGIDGEIADYCFCWNGENFRKYTIESILAYTVINPENVWIDDDLRVFNHSPVNFGCFCDDCIKKFNVKYRHNFTREQLKDKILYSDMQVRREYVEFTKQSLGKFVYDICKAFHDKCPDASFGYQYGDLKTELLFGSEFVFENMYKASGKKPKARPGGGNYNDYEPMLIVNKCMHINYLNANLPDYVEVRCPEIENTPDVVFGKSVNGTCLETSLYLAYGNNEMSYAAMMRSYEPMSFYNELLAEFSKQRSYWETLIKLNKNTRQSGLRYILAKSNAGKKFLPGEGVGGFHANVYMKLNGFCRTAIPVSFEKCGDVYLLDNVNAGILDEEELKGLLNKNVIMDSEAFGIVNSRLKAFDIKVEKMDSDLSLTVHENAVDHVVNENAFCRRWAPSCWTGVLKPDILFNTDGAEIVSEYVSDKDENKKVGAAACIIKSGNYKWAIFADDLWNCTISKDKRNQIVNVANYLCDESIKVFVNSNHQGILMPRENENGEITSVSFFNYTVGCERKIEFKIRRPAGSKFFFISQEQEKTELKAVKDKDSVTVCADKLSAFTVGTICIE